MDIHFLFPTVVTTDINPDIPLAEHKLLINANYQKNLKYGSFKVSEDTYILNRVPALKAWIQERVNEYTLKIMGTTDKLKFTQSWCIKHNNEPQKIYPHTHGNSIISGSYYVDAPANTEGLRIQKQYHSTYSYVSPNIDRETNDKMWLWSHIDFPVSTGKLILFPSQMLHSVPGVKSKNQQRCVLAFNTWFDGSFGSEDQLTRVE
jgi:uncharacterized protein (TIGR02466 family)